MKIKHLFFSVLLISAFIINACKDDIQQNELGVIVDVTIDLNLPEFFELSTIGGVTYLIGGYQGIIVRRNQQDEFVAYDRQCPVDPDFICRLQADPSGLFAENEECCEAKFALFDGVIVEGSSPRNLYQYQTFYNFSTNQLRITN